MRGKSFYLIKTQCGIITTCCLLPNHIRREMIESLDHELIEEEENRVQRDMITHVETLDAWTLWIVELA